MKRIIVKTLSWLMLVIFLSGIIPKEYLHDTFLHHHDDIHPSYKKGVFVFTPKHHHCPIFIFDLGLFITAEKPVIVFSKKLIHTRHFPAFFYSVFTYSTEEVLLRGPPIAC